MKEFLSDDIMLTNEKARELYAYAKGLPIFDYHCHLSPKEIFEDKKFLNLTELWISGDHYKWRLMRAYGIEEKYVTGNAEPYEKFVKFAEALPNFIANPVYHWAHFELKRYFGISLPICPENAEEIWKLTKDKMADGTFSARKLIAASGVETLITTDDPASDLSFHEKLKGENLPFRVLPCFRADALFNSDEEYISEFAAATGIKITGFNSLMRAVAKRLDYFISRGCVSADVSFTDFPDVFSKDEKEKFKADFLVSLAALLEERGMAFQIHTGVMRNCNGKLYSKIGADAGGDSVADVVNIVNARNFFERISQNGALPKTIVYTLNPASYYPLSTLLGDFQGGGRGRLQLGAAWWFLDHRDGIKEQLKITAATGGLGLFTGMLTDSRSFTSYARHDYFRRILCSLIGEWVEAGEYPDDAERLKKLVGGICFENAKKYFGGEK